MSSIGKQVSYRIPYWVLILPQYIKTNPSINPSDHVGTTTMVSYLATDNKCVRTLQVVSGCSCG